MRVVETFPHAIREIENCWIPMSDGCRLAARIWLPESAEQSPVPAIVEYLPYRKRVGTRWRDEPMHRYFAGHGYAAVRIDLRGSGESDGLLLDEYLPQEQADGVEAIRWIARQAWCTGSVGMMGKSWGGFNSLQVAALAPPELKAVLTVCSTDDRYADDAHFMGGCLLNENLIWGSVLQTINAQAPDPELVGERWREMWLERLAKSPLFAETWLRHQLRDEYWCHGSVCEDFRAIRCPVYAVGGWADGYTNAVPRLLAGLDVPRKGLVGPWAHLYPHEGVPGPAIGFLQEALRWWDQWLKGRDTGILDEPMLRVWMQEGRESSALPRTRPGRWVAEEAWPSPRIEPRRMVLAGGGRLALERGEAREERLELAPSQTVGVAAGAWCGFGVEGETPDDQREDDARSLVFDSEPLAERVEVLGAPLVHLELAIDRPLALVAVRLNELDPRGRSTRVTYGLANLTHRRGHERSEPARPGERFAVRVRLNDVAHSFAPGNRLRVAVSTSYWPVVWPSPEPVRLSLFAGASALELPVRPPRPADGDLRPFPPPEAAPPLDFTDLEPGGFHRRIERDAETGALVHVFANDVAEDGEPAMSRVHPIEMEVGHGILERFRIREDEPLSAEAAIVHTTTERRGEWSTRVETRTRLTATRETFELRAELDAYEGMTCVLSRRWERSIPRDGV